MTRIIKGGRSLLVDAVVRHLRTGGFPTMRSTHAQVFESIDPEGTRLTTLAQRARMSHQAMGELVTELIEDGYLERIPDPADGRARLIRPTALGHEQIALGMAHLTAIRRRWEHELDDLTVDQVLDALDALARVCQSPEESENDGDRLLAIGRDAAPRLVEPFRSAAHGELLYDENGLPK